MKKLIAPISVGLLCMSFTIVPDLAGHHAAEKNSAGSNILPAKFFYDHAGLQQAGLSYRAFYAGMSGYQKLSQSQKLSNPKYLAICDYSHPSSFPRFYIIDMKECRLLCQSLVAHGKNSGLEYATRFSNTEESLQSSLGFYVTGSTYTGENGLSLRLHGLEPGINNNAYKRAIVMHGAAYVDARRAGRSWGCPALSKKDAKKIIPLIRNGACLFIWQQNAYDERNSTILNG